MSEDPFAPYMRDLKKILANPEERTKLEASSVNLLRALGGGSREGVDPELMKLIDELPKSDSPKGELLALAQECLRKLDEDRK